MNAQQFEKRGLKSSEAAEYRGVSQSGFHKWVKEGIIPGPWPGTRRYDGVALDAALDKMSGIEQDSAPLHRVAKEKEAMRVNLEDFNSTAKLAGET